MDEIYYEIVLKFPCYCKVVEFLADLENWQEWKAKKAEKRETDQREKHTKENHRRAREFQSAHPMFSYRDCYMIVKREKRLLL